MAVLEQSEKIYRATVKTSRKYPKRLTDYIDALVKHGRLLEAKHFFLDLCQLGPNHPKTIRLGYTIAIATFDNDWIYKYDQLLTTSTKDSSEVYWYRLRYYHSQNNITACENTSCELLKAKLNTHRLSTIIEVCMARRSYLIAQSLAEYLSINHVTLTPQYNKLLKQIVITRLTHSIQRHL